ncbi:sigma-54-dependent Fis family transcriptional regulator [Paracoccus aminophilus]|uniref:Acetoin transcriptional regulator, AcoR n=1 Tax=Paracoccus aminophilus JCM 7686 TaxID=1367847 RepID=S5Y9R9_PARAH|nr:sigma-54-dependent Fis family transcriptional regulator [Paracoccus aminophilus]AGT08088.1 acetoin transcriptional regulator, AcoR [Paracoccus aminophilus JCM 7686]
MSDLHHIREIESVRAGHEAARHPIVVESWLRCLNEHGLDPTARAAAHIVTERELRLHRERSGDLIEIARSGIERLYALVAGQNYVLMLSDRDGVTVEYLGDAVQKEGLRRSGLYLGAEWSEARAGTCALGACLEAGEALIIHQTDHFDVTHAGLSCTAAPIYDTRGQLAAALDISLLSSPLPRASQSMALNLVRQTVRRIEMANIMAENRHDWVLRLAGSPDFLDVDPEAAVALDGAGRVIGATHGAMRVLTAAAGVPWREGHRLIGRPLSDFLNIRLDRLDDLTRDRPAAERLIETRDGHRLFAHAIEPRAQPLRSPARPALARTGALPTPLRALAGDDPAMASLLARAAALAPSTLPVLIEGETGSGKLTLARAIHEVSGRRAFVTLSAAELSEPEAEAQLFGRIAARRVENGLLSELGGGTLVLQNVEDLPERVQTRLSRLLAEGGFVPLGGLRPVPVDLRIIATSQHGAARLRPDFYHRLCGGLLSLPRLAARQDLLWLARRMTESAAGQRLDLPPDIMRALAERDWPGNLRELGFVARALAGLVEGRSLPVAPALALLGPAQPKTGAPSEAALLAQMLEASGGNISLCARRLGVDRSTIHRRLRRYGLVGRG